MKFQDQAKWCNLIQLLGFGRTYGPIWRSNITIMGVPPQTFQPGVYLTSFRWYILLFFLFSIVNLKLYLCNSEFSGIFVDIGFHKKSPDPWWIKTSNQEIWATRCYQFCIDLLYHGSVAKDFPEQREFTFFMVDCADLVTFPNPTKTWFL